MTHSEAQLLIGAAPHDAVSPELAEHLANCAECAQFQREMLTLDGNIRRALELSLLGTSAAAPASTGPNDSTGNDPTGASAPTPTATTPTATTPTSSTPSVPTPPAPTPITSARSVRQRPTHTTWWGWAIAASVAIAFTVAIWALRPSDTLARDVVKHIGHEPESWTSTQPVPTAAVNEVLSKAGVALDMSSDKVMYAQSCYVRGHLVPHLVVKTASGPITVIILPDEKVKERTSFHESGMSGVITPAPRGSLAVLAQGDENVDAVAAEVQKSVRWLR